MKFDEQDVERAAPRVWAEDYFFCHGAYPDEADPPVRWEDIPEAFRVHARALSRVALGAMEREPIEDVLDGIDLTEMHVALLVTGTYQVMLTTGEDEWGTDDQPVGFGTTPTEAIRNAVANAKGDE